MIKALGFIKYNCTDYVPPDQSHLEEETVVEKNNTANIIMWVLIVVILVAAIVGIIVGVLIYKKY